MQSTFQIEKNKLIIKRWLTLFMIVLVLSGLTAMPVEWELSIAIKFFDQDSFIGSWLGELIIV